MPETQTQRLQRALREVEELLTDFLLSNTDEAQGFEAIPEIDEARTIAQEALGEFN
jgi:hypothetical protein